MTEGSLSSIHPTLSPEAPKKTRGSDNIRSIWLRSFSQRVVGSVMFPRREQDPFILPQWGRESKNTVLVCWGRHHSAP